MLLRRNGLRYQRRYLRSNSRYSCHVAPTGSVGESIDELERQFLNKYEPCASHKECMRPLHETNSLIDTTCPVGDTDPTKRYKVKGSANNSVMYDRCHRPTRQERCDQPARPSQERCDQPACPSQQERCNEPTYSAPPSSRHRTPKHSVPSWKMLPTEKSSAAGNEAINKTNRSSSLNSRSPRPPLVSDIVSKNRQQSSRSGTPRDSPGHSESKSHKRIVPGLFLKDISPSGTGADSERSNTKDSTRRLSKLKKTEFVKRSVDSKQSTKHKQQTYQHESMTEDEYKSPAKTHDSASLSAKSGPDNSLRLSGKSRPDGSLRLSAKNRSEGSPRLAAKIRPHGSSRLAAKSDKKTIFSPSDSKRSSAGSSTRSFPKSKPSRKLPSLAKSFKIRVKNNKSKRKKESRLSSPEVDDGEPYIRVDISPRKETIDGNNCLNTEYPEKSPCSDEGAVVGETALRETAAQDSPRISPCPCFRSFLPESEEISPRHSRNSPRVTLAVKSRSKQPCYNPECPKKAACRSPSADEDVVANKIHHFKLPCYNPNCPKKSPRRSMGADEDVGPSNGIPLSNLICSNLECPKKSPRRPSRVDEDVGTSKEIPRSKIPCYNLECSKRSPRKSSCVDENVCPSNDFDRYKPPCLTRGPVIPVYDRPPCMGYMVPPGVKDTLKDIVNKITIFGLSSGTPEVGPNKPVTGPCMSTTEESDTRRSVRLCDASTACSGNIEELFFNRYLQKSDASVDCDRVHASFKDSTSHPECKANRKYIKTQNDDCSCALKQENERLRQIVGNMENQLGDYHQRMCAVECALKNKDDIIKKYKKLLDEKGEELENAQQQIAGLTDKERDQNSNRESIMEQLQKTQGVLQERTAELAYAERKCAEHESTINELREQLEKADRIIKENVKVRSEVAHLTQQVALWRRQLVDSEARVRSVEAELQRTRARAAEAEACYRDKAQSAAALQEQLEDAHGRGAQLCAEARRVVQGVRHWVRNMKQQQREQEAKINEQTATIAVLEETLGMPRRASPVASPETPFVGAPVRSSTRTGQTLAGRFRSSERPECDFCDSCKDTSADTELPTTSRTDKTSNQVCRCRQRDCERPGCSPPPEPPRRQLKVKMCENMGPLSPTAELFERVERLQDALTDGQRRWQSRGCNTAHQ
ncbi:uncharacterized protein LOC113234821 isoform X2 [Hyposmocoma kahamanoa]|uniref:uncharacterized protein LOC113234821 isoform X2 n=1 Tax=Hyposmocoma kahamanoa TaxID=1477025 RepID=UPI000E6DA26C|nr:uncharacterized protein LOC113234821 isoform X2 [Hyposmocoma kahamanoa]